MKNYKIWESENNVEKIIEVFNYCDLIDVQKEFIEKGYIILKIYQIDTHTFMWVKEF